MLKVDYSIEDMTDPFAVETETVDAGLFLSKFQFRFIPGPQYEDLLNNNVSWIIVSPRLISVLKSCRNASDLQLVELPESIFSPDERLKGFSILGVRRRVACLDESRSDIRWGTLPSGKKHVLALYDFVLKESQIPEDCDVFFIDEYPAYPVFSHELAAEIATLYPRGFVYKEIEAL